MIKRNSVKLMAWLSAAGVSIWLAACHPTQIKTPSAAPDVSGIVQSGQDAFTKKDFALAEQKAREATKLDPSSVEARLLLVKILGPESPESIIHLQKLVELNPKRVEAYILLSDAYLRQNKFKEAIKTAEAGLKHEQNASLYLMLGIASLELGDAAEARGAFLVAVDLAPRSIKPKLLLGASCSAMGDIEGAIDAYFDALDIDSNNPVARMSIAEIFIDNQGATEAIELLEGIRWEDNPPARYFSLLGIAYRDQERFAEAIASLDMAVRLEPKQVEYTVALGQAIYDSGDQAEATKIFAEAFASWPKELEVAINYAFVLVAQKDNKAGEVISTLQKLAPPGDLATLSLAAEHSINQKEYTKAIASLEEAAKQNPKSIEPLLRMAEVYEEENLPEDAANAYLRAQARDPKDPRAGIRIAMLYAKKDPNKALSALDEVLIKNPGLVDALIARAQLLIEVNRFQDAVKNFEEALALEPESASIYNNFAWALVYDAKPEEKDCKRGLSLAEKAVALSESKRAAPLDTLAEAHRCNGNYEQALKFLDQALALDPTSDFYQKRRAEFAQESKQKKSKPKK
jgi:cytochrome c-type biogenesis protein CcmH/NrfG